jgi:hypothetical protein
MTWLHICGLPNETTFVPRSPGVPDKNAATPKLGAKRGPKLNYACAESVRH